MKEGTKYDDGKLRYDLLPFDALEQIVRVITFGANKYDDNNWKLVQNPIQRYEAALLRHISAHMQGELFDKETGLYHLAHAGCNILFLLYFLLRQDENVTSLKVYDHR